MGSPNNLDALLIDDLDIHIGRWQDTTSMPMANDLVILPHSVQFPRTPLANLESHAVTIFNKHHNKTVYLNSVIALPPLEDDRLMHNDFHVPFVRDQPIAPQGNFTLTIVFLPTRIGEARAEIVLRTSFGQMRLPVEGVGVASPFKVVPLTQLVAYAGVNSNAAMIPDITLYNPYDTPIQITEVFSSGGKFYLELPTRDASSSSESTDDVQAQLWTIAAYEKRPVIRVRFVGSLVAGNYSAYIRMKVKCQTNVAEMEEEQSLVIPIRMEVRMMQPVSLYPEQSLIDLGSVLLTERGSLSINIHTSDTPDIGVASLAWDAELAIGEAKTKFHRTLDCNDIVVGDDAHVRLKIECDLEWSNVIGNISRQWDGFVAGSVMYISGEVTVNSTVGPKKSSQLHRIPLFAELISGRGIELPANITILYPKASRASISIVYLRNNFDTTIVLRGVELVPQKGAENHSAFLALEEHLQSAVANEFPKILRPGESWTMAPTELLLDIAPGQDADDVLRSFSGSLHISTNITDSIKVPLFGYSGRLTRLVLNDVKNAISGKGAFTLRESEIVAKENARVLEIHPKRLNVESQKFIALWNDNPVAVELLKWDLPAMDITLSIFNVGCMNKYDFGQNKESQLQPDDWCVFQFTATTQRSGEFNGTFQYETNYEEGEFPLRVIGKAGSLILDPKSLVMRNCFPVSKKVT